MHLAENSGGQVQVTVGSPNLPSDINYGVHDVASAFKKFLGFLPGGILGSVSLFNALQEVEAQPENSRGDQHISTQMKIRLVALAVLSLGSSRRIAIVSAVFGLLSLLKQDPDDRSCPSPSAPRAKGSEAMSSKALAVVFAPTLLGNFTEQIDLRPPPSEKGQAKFLETPRRSFMHAFKTPKHAKSDSQERSPEMNAGIQRSNSAAAVIEFLVRNWEAIVREIQTLDSVPNSRRSSRSMQELTSFRAPAGHQHLRAKAIRPSFELGGLNNTAGWAHDLRESPNEIRHTSSISDSSRSHEGTAQDIKLSQSGILPQGHKADVRHDTEQTRPELQRTAPLVSSSSSRRDQSSAKQCLSPSRNCDDKAQLVAAGYEGPAWWERQFQKPDRTPPKVPRKQEKTLEQSTGAITSHQVPVSPKKAQPRNSIDKDVSNADQPHAPCVDPQGRNIIEEFSGHRCLGCVNLAVPDLSPSPSTHNVSSVLVDRLKSTQPLGCRSEGHSPRIADSEAINQQQEVSSLSENKREPESPQLRDEASRVQVDVSASNISGRRNPALHITPSDCKSFEESSRLDSPNVQSFPSQKKDSPCRIPKPVTEVGRSRKSTPNSAEGLKKHARQRTLGKGDEDIAPIDIGNKSRVLSAAGPQSARELRVPEMGDSFGGRYPSARRGPTPGAMFSTIPRQRDCSGSSTRYRYRRLNVEEPPVARRLLFPPSNEDSRSRNMSSNYNEDTFWQSNRGNVTTLYAEVRKLKHQLDCRNEEIWQLRQQLNAMKDSKDTGTLSEKLRETERDLLVWKHRAESAEGTLFRRERLQTSSQVL